ncbi:MAG: hypothetical protein F4229_16120, partial [Gammaproteobacteria bacterium]|nr:hypothetical protein [Gammaproteobacteria bacterium]
MKDRICQDSSCEVRARQGVAALRERIATTGQAFFGGQLVSRAASAGRDLLRTLFGLPLLACLAAGAQAQGTTDVVSFAPAAGAPTTITEGGSPVEFLLGSDNVAVPPGTFFNLNVSGSVNRFDYQMDQWSGSSWVRVSLESESTNTLILGSAYLFPSRLRLTALGDSVLEGDETLTLTLRQGEGYQVGSPSSASLTVVDANRAPSFAIDARTFTIAEDAAPGSDVGTPLPAATDPNGDSLTYSMEGTDAALFSFNS